VTEAWRREQYTTGGGTGKVALIALARVKLPDPLPISRRLHGMPDDSEGADAVSLAARDRAADPAWFTEQVIAPFLDLIGNDLGAEAVATALAAEHAYVIEAHVDDPDDLGHLQATWALAKCVCEEGASLVIDVYAARVHLGSEVAQLAPDRDLDIMHEVTLFFDEQADGSLAAWSFGLCKFGRPDLVRLGLRADDPEVVADTASLLRDVAATLAAGERIEPGDTIETPDGQALVAHAFTPADAPGVGVDGPALVLVDVAPSP
jgi:hypothetical protein